MNANNISVDPHPFPLLHPRQRQRSALLTQYQSLGFLPVNNFFDDYPVRATSDAAGDGHKTSPDSARAPGCSHPGTSQRCHYSIAIQRLWRIIVHRTQNLSSMHPMSVNPEPGRTLEKRLKDAPYRIKTGPEINRAVK